MSEGKEPTAEREIERPTLHPSFPSRRATFLRGQTNGSVLLGKGWGRSGPEVTIRVGKRLPFVPVGHRHGRRSRRGALPSKDRVGHRLLAASGNSSGRRQRTGGDVA